MPITCWKWLYLAPSFTKLSVLNPPAYTKPMTCSIAAHWGWGRLWSLLMSDISPSNRLVMVGEWLVIGSLIKCARKHDKSTMGNVLKPRVWGWHSTEGWKHDHLAMVWHNSLTWSIDIDKLHFSPDPLLYPTHSICDRKHYYPVYLVCTIKNIFRI